MAGGRAFLQKKGRGSTTAALSCATGEGRDANAGLSRRQRWQRWRGEGGDAGKMALTDGLGQAADVREGATAGSAGGIDRLRVLAVSRGHLDLRPDGHSVPL